jgi:hypothetical protein
MLDLEAVILDPKEDNLCLAREQSGAVGYSGVEQGRPRTRSMEEVCWRGWGRAGGERLGRSKDGSGGSRGGSWEPAGNGGATTEGWGRRRQGNPAGVVVAPTFALVRLRSKDGEENDRIYELGERVYEIKLFGQAVTFYRKYYKMKWTSLENGLAVRAEAAGSTSIGASRFLPITCFGFGKAKMDRVVTRGGGGGE